MEDKKPVYLMFVDPNFGNQGHNKYYNAFPLGDGTFKVEYGRVGSNPQTKVYPMGKWEAQIKSKIKKGYINISDNMTEVIEDAKVEDENKKSDAFSVIENLSIRNIVKRLFDFANNAIQNAYNVKSNLVTQAMIDKAQSILDDLKINYSKHTLEENNKKLVELFTVIPRKMQYVSSYLFTSLDSEEAERILDREQSILDTMAGQVYVPKKKNMNEENKKDVKTCSMLDQMGIIMEEVNEEDIAKIKKAMGDSANKFYNAWKVTNLETEQEYNKFVKENNIGNVKLLCHGSRNQNIFNILKIGLKIRPSCAIHTGSMLGDALYYSNPEKEHGGVAKSIGYTSLTGSYWSGGNSNCGFLIFFDVALGKSYDIYSFNSKYYTYNLEKLQKDCPGAWSLHLHGVGHRNGSTVINDEITVYNVNQVTVRYLVEIR